VEDTLGDAAQHEPLDGSEPAGPDDDEVDAGLAGGSDELLAGVANNN
jgi:hypothetical protein